MKWGAAGAFEGSPVTVVLFPLIRIAENRVRLLNFLESLGRVFVVGSCVGMILSRELFVGLADFLIRGLAGHPQRFVVVFCRHRATPAQTQSARSNCMDAARILSRPRNSSVGVFHRTLVSPI